METTLEELQSQQDSRQNELRCSIYIPTHPRSNDQAIMEDTTRLKNALQNIKNNPKFEEADLTETIEKLYDILNDTEFWKHQSVGLGIFADHEGFRYVHLPYEPTEATYLETAFVLSPLYITESLTKQFFVLDINLDRPTLYKSSDSTLAEIKDIGMPESFQKEMGRDEYNVELQHQAAPRGNNGGNTRFHGHDPAEEVDDDIKRYLKLIAKAADSCLEGKHEPLVLSGTESRVGNIRNYLSYPHVLSDSVAGNHEGQSPQHLYDTTAEVVEQQNDTERQALIEKLEESTPAYQVRGAQEIVEAAQAGRVERLNFPAFRKTTDSVRPGDFTSIILQLPEDSSEMEQLVRATVAQGGEVLATEIDTAEEKNIPRALCRY